MLSLFYILDINIKRCLKLASTFIKGYTVQFLHRVSILSEALSVSVVVNSVDIFSAIKHCAALKNVTVTRAPFNL